MPRVSRKPQNIVAEAQQPSIRMYKAAIYIRLSVEDIRKKISDSVGNQKALVMKYLQSQPDMQLYDIYEDVNFTGTNFNRPGFTRMIEDIQAGLVDCVVVKDLSRFGRSFEETGHYLERVFPFLQVRFVAVGENFDSLTATIDESFLMVPLRNLINEVYARDVSKKVTSSYKAKRTRGEFCGSIAPYGYVKDGPHFVVDEEAAAVVKQIYTWRLEGMGIMAIVKKLNSLGIHPPARHLYEKGLSTAKKYENALYWYKSSVKRILSYTAYTGELALGRYKSQFQKGITSVDESEWVICKDAHPAIIDQETFEAVRQIAKTCKDEYIRPKNEFSENIFKGLIVCGDCGRHMSREKFREKYAFVCYVSRSVDRKSCTLKTLREADLHTALYAYIKREIDLATEINLLIAKLQSQKSYKHKQNVMDAEIATLKRKLEQNRLYRGSLREDLKDGVLTESDYTTMKADYESEKDKLKQSIDELLVAKTRQDETVSHENKWTTELKRFESEEQLSAGMVSALVERIRVYDGGRIEVFFHYSKTPSPPV